MLEELKEFVNKSRFSFHLLLSFLKGYNCSDNEFLCNYKNIKTCIRKENDEILVYKIGD